MEPKTALFQKIFGAIYQSFVDAGGSLDVAGTPPPIRTLRFKGRSRRTALRSRQTVYGAVDMGQEIPAYFPAFSR